MSKPQNITISVASGIKGKIDEFAVTMGLKRSDVLRLALYTYLNIPQRLLEGSHSEGKGAGNGKSNTATNCSGK